MSRCDFFFIGWFRFFLSLWSFARGTRSLMIPFFYNSFSFFSCHLSCPYLYCSFCRISIGLYMSFYFSHDCDHLRGDSSLFRCFWEVCYSSSCVSRNSHSSLTRLSSKSLERRFFFFRENDTWSSTFTYFTPKYSHRCIFFYISIHIHI